MCEVKKVFKFEILFKVILKFLFFLFGEGRVGVDLGVWVKNIRNLKIRFFFKKKIMDGEG